MAVVQTALQGYNYIFDELADPRTKDWWLVSGPGPLLTILASYLYFCTKAGPKYMESRKPYNLKTVVMWYNVFQIALSVYICTMGLYFVLTERYSNGCYSVDQSDSPRAMLIVNMWNVDSAIIVPIVVSVNGLIAKSLDRHLKRLTLSGWVKGQIQKAVLLDTARTVRRFLSLESQPPVAWILFPIPWASGVWWFYFGKISELLDTVFFVLRKKERQISFLHLYHHTIMPIVSFIGIKYAAGGQAVPEGSINAFIHVVMYTYYLIAGLGPQYQKYLWWKKYVTSMQLIQFCIVVFLNVNSLSSTSCNYPKFLSVIVMFNCFAFLYMFGMFYYNNYVKSRSNKRVTIQEEKEKEL